jgi:RNA-directed DNA polymerase
LETIIRELNPILRKREKRPGFGLKTRDHFRWPNAFFAEHGLFTLSANCMKGLGIRV